ncbi:Leucine-rich repeat-containing protein 19 [Bagarius yarrelli]|uniref:Leucine-rich repeat-containing protein 19 n=1 Tax=Bagarius yarrelli TaxID=175774 RepID=A0A556TYK8_BAGYA|nr:Leucine-rich repeat-containing protein 19 [Bagarius yarrelli]
MVKEVVVLWTAALLAAASAELLVNVSIKVLSNIPVTHSANTTRLILHHNRITMSSSDIRALRNYSSLRELDLSYNLITQLPDGAFSALSSLETLRLTGNGLQTIRNQTFTDLKKLRTLDLGLNPWDCTQELVALVKWMNDVKLRTDTSTEAERTGQKSGVTNTWKFLTGVIVIILCTSMFIVCAVKSPIWHKMLFDYRHQRLREAEDPAIFNTGRYSNFSLDTEQTETSAQELDQGLTEPPEDEDGFIEDGYIQPEDYKERADVGVPIV